jgi:hypothetical protein
MLASLLLRELLFGGDGFVFFFGTSGRPIIVVTFNF